ncbi:MAG: LysR family transcriptional regulator [Myxococcales bacterium]|nr:LysR family transcriptional regulator [Myxococcales bacterium]MCB9748891.1 LysR family transcriptional regulator [Myxococcales bacterium]
MNLERIRALVGFHAHGNLPRAAAALGVSARTLRGRLAALEDEVGVALFHREGRLLTLTAHAIELARGGRELLRSADAAIERVVSKTEEIIGDFRVAIPVGLPPPILVMIMRFGLTRYPRLRSQVFPVARPLSLLPDEADIAMTFARRPADGPWLSAQLMQTREGLYASPEYLAREGAPRSLEELHRHDLFSWIPPDQPADEWPLRDGGALVVQLAHSSPDMGLIRQCGIAGLGIVRFPRGEFPDPLVPDTLVPVLPELVRREVPVRAVMPDTPRMRRSFLAFFGNVREGVKGLGDG